MKLWKIAKVWGGLLGMVSAAVLLAGCQTQGPVFTEVPGITQPDSSAGRNVDVFHVGDLVQITFVSATSDRLFPPHEEKIKQDGTITPPYVGSVVAAGKTAGEVQRELQTKYNDLYRNVTVTVQHGNRFFYVDGEVMRRGALPYLGETDIIKAISAAGGFTEYARKTRIRLIHSDGKTEVINYNRAIEDPSYKVSVYPGDRIYVPRRFF
jgi:polysaccharide biosynthesis/export protein VpsN